MRSVRLDCLGDQISFSEGLLHMLEQGFVGFDELLGLIVSSHNVHVFAQFFTVALQRLFLFLFRLLGILSAAVVVTAIVSIGTVGVTVAISTTATVAVAVVTTTSATVVSAGTVGGTWSRRTRHVKNLLVKRLWKTGTLPVYVGRNDQL